MRLSGPILPVWALLFLLLSRSLALDLALQEAKRHVLKSGRGSSLDPSPWPTDHGDSARAKFTLGAGLPASSAQNPAGISVAGSGELSRAQWLYTRGDGDVYALRGGALTPEIVRVDSVKMTVKQRVPIPSSL